MELQKTDSYAKAYVEILEIINNMGKEYKKKIPSKLLDLFEENKDLDYSFQLNGRQIFSDKTIGLLAMLESKYLANDDEKELLNKALAENEDNYQKELREKYNPDNLFQNKIDKVEIVENPVVMVEYKESIIKKIKNWVKRTFNKKKELCEKKLTMKIHYVIILNCNRINKVHKV